MSTLFGNTSGSSVFGQNTQQQQNKPNLFGSLNTNTATSQGQTGGGLFGNLGATSQPQQSGGGLFGATLPPQQQQSGGGLFGNLGSTSQPQQGGGLFGATTQPQQQQSGGGLLGNLGGSTNQQNQQSGGGLFSGQQQPQQPQQGGGLFGNLGGSTNQQHGGGGLFGSLGNTANQQPQQQNQQQQGSSLFGNFGQPAQQPQQNQLQGSLLSQSRGLFQQSEYAPPQRSVTQQIELALAKWNPQNPKTLFRTYLYNTVAPEQTPFYGPGPDDREAEYEEALAKKPSPGAVPFLVKGFWELGKRMETQIIALNTLRGRLHEIDDGLNNLIRKHDLQISIRAAECRRKHLRLSHQCLGLAAKTQVLRNRGYAMDSAEEELRKKLLLLERSVFDPALNGRGEEIWARMVSVRERGRLLQREFEKAGRGIGQESGVVVDEEVMKRVKKILEDYSSQLGQLTKELAQIRKDWTEWEASMKPLAIMGR